jgi:hypothetical protein
MRRRVKTPLTLTIIVMAVELTILAIGIAYHYQHR